MDLKLKETGSGGDVTFDNGDIQLTSEIYNQPYLAHFGGNVEGISTDYPDGVERGDWWGNMLLQENEALDSSFEKSLRENELSSSGRLKIQSAAEKDLEYLSGIAYTTSNLTITGIDKVELKDEINETSKFSYIWNEAKDEII